MSAGKRERDDDSSTVHKKESERVILLQYTVLIVLLLLTQIWKNARRNNTNQRQRLRGHRAVHHILNKISHNQAFGRYEEKSRTIAARWILACQNGTINFNELRDAQRVLAFLIAL